MQSGVLDFLVFEHWHKKTGTGTLVYVGVLV